MVSSSEYKSKRCELENFCSRSHSLIFFLLSTTHIRRVGGVVRVSGVVREGGVGRVGVGR